MDQTYFDPRCAACRVSRERNLTQWERNLALRSRRRTEMVDVRVRRTDPLVRLSRQKIDNLVSTLAHEVSILGIEATSAGDAANVALADRLSLVMRRLNDMLED